MVEQVVAQQSRRSFSGLREVGVPDSEAALEIARYLARVWRIHNTPEFVASIAKDFGYYAALAPAFARIFIAQAVYGDAANGVIGGEIRQWWLADGSGLREADFEFPDFVADGDFYTSPVLAFFLDGNSVAIGEWLGPSIRRRTVGRYASGHHEPCVTELKVIWCRSPNYRLP